MTGRTMRALVCRAFGPPEDLRVEDVARPAPGPEEALVEVAAAGVNFADVLMAAGRYQVKPPLPFVAGSELAGTVVEAGPGSAWRVGDRVMGAPAAGGAFAEYACVPDARLFAAPETLSFELAAGLLIGHGTAAFALDRGGLKPGERVLVTGAGGGVGIAAVEIARRMGAFVIAAAGSPEKLAAAAAHGADAAVDYRTEDLARQVKALTGGQGADVVLDTVGGAVFDAALKSTARWARVLVVGFAGGTIPRIPAEYLLIKNLTAIGVGFGATLVDGRPMAQAAVDRLLALHARDPFAPEIAGRLGLEEAAAGLRRLADRAVTGKLIVTPRA